jgi:pimeloyl-ACP methyl ester carboxylesterase
LGFNGRMLLYLHGFASGPGSTKARMLGERFRAAGIPMECPDLTPGAEGFERSTPSSMLALAERLLKGAPGPHFLMGSSLGGYLAAVAASRGNGIARLVLLAPAFRLADRWKARLGPEAVARWRREGSMEVPHYASGSNRRIGVAFLEDAERLPPFPEVKVPTLCIAGRQDDLVPLKDVGAFVERTPGSRLIPLEDGHELSGSIDRIWEEARAFLTPGL